MGLLGAQGQFGRIALALKAQNQRRAPNDYVGRSGIKPLPSSQSKRKIKVRRKPRNDQDYYDQESRRMNREQRNRRHQFRDEEEDYHNNTYQRYQLRDVIQEGGREIPDSLEYSLANHSPDAVRLTRKLKDNQSLYREQEKSLLRKIEKYKHDIQMGKKRENKLMFFIYILKEEKNCPVQEVFEEYIKPIETNRFSADYGIDYRRVLNQIKKHNRYDRLFNKAVKKIRLVQGSKDYKSDSCLPTYQKQPFEAREEPRSQRRGLRGSRTTPKLKPEYQRRKNNRSFTVVNKSMTKGVVRIRNDRNGRNISMPTLNFTGMGMNNRIYMRGNGDFQTLKKSHSQLDYANIEGYNQPNTRTAFRDSYSDQFNFATSSGDETKDRQKVRDIIFDPARRKRLMDSLNIMTVRNKWDELNSASV